MPAFFEEQKFACICNFTELLIRKMIKGGFGQIRFLQLKKVFIYYGKYDPKGYHWLTFNKSHSNKYYF